MISLFHRLLWKPKPEPAPESVKLRNCAACGARYHPSWNGQHEQHLCPDCSGAS